MPRTKLQIVTAIILLGIMGMYALYTNHENFATACVTGIVAIGMRLLDHTPSPPPDFPQPPKG